MKNTLLCLSGGLDSASLLFEYQDRIAQAITFDYGSVQNKRELESAKLLTSKLGIPHRIIDLRSVFKGFDSALLTGEGIPTQDYNQENMSSTIVPFRNGIFLSILAGLAESTDCQYIALASHSGDHYIYPDCRPEFSAAMDTAIRLGTSNQVEFFRPYNLLTKRQIAERGIAHGLNPDWTYSCYQGGAHHCHQCPTCRERDQALEGLVW